MSPDFEERFAKMVDRQEIQDLVARERFARDQMRYDVMAECFHPDAHIETSWFNGNGVDYITATEAFMKRVGGGKHWIFPGFVQVNGNRALVESPGMIYNRNTIEGVEVDYNIYARYHCRVEKREDRIWRLLTFNVIWERDMMQCVNPNETLPIDWERLKKYRKSYRFLAYLQDTRNVTLSHELQGDDRPEQLKEFHKTEEAWLNEPI